MSVTTILRKRGLSPLRGMVVLLFATPVQFPLIIPLPSSFLSNSDDDDNDRRDEFEPSILVSFVVVDVAAAAVTVELEVHFGGRLVEDT